jgi:hypothetical protein
VDAASRRCPWLIRVLQLRKFIPRRPSPSFIVAMVMLSSAFSLPLQADIYKWVDEQGNVHFGDKPLDPDRASQAQAVKLKQGYQPTERTAQEQQEFEREQWLQGKRTEMLRRDEEKAAAEAQARRQQAKAERCNDLQETLTKLDTVAMENGVRVITYLEDDTGQSVSSDRQREFVSELKAEIATLGCP